MIHWIVLKMLHGEVAEKFSQEVGKSIANVITTIIHGGNAHEVRASVAYGITETIKLTSEELYKEGWKGVAGTLFLPYSIASGIYDWISPIIPCLIPEAEAPNIDQAQQAKSPLVIDLDGNGIATYALKNGVYFDIDADGFAEKTAWINAQDAFLVIDKNGNGLIDSA